MSRFEPGSGGAWAARIAALGWRPQSFLAMARLLREALELVLHARTAPQTGSETSGSAVDLERVDWEGAYRTQPETVGRLLGTLDPGLSANPPIDMVSSPTSPAADSELGLWLRDTMERFEKIVRKIDGLADSETGTVSDEALKRGEFRAFVETAKADAHRFAREIRAGADNALALMLRARPMQDLILAAKSGDDDALIAAVQINPRVINIEGINARVRRAVQARDDRFLHRLERALKLGPAVQKNAKVGFTLAVLWEAGLKRLRYPQIRGFLKAAGFHGVPAPQALERYAQRMGLKKYWID